jgi:hypothetical protein
MRAALSPCSELTMIEQASQPLVHSASPWQNHHVAREAPLYLRPVTEIAHAIGNRRIRSCMASAATPAVLAWGAAMKEAVGRDRSCGAANLSGVHRAAHLDPAFLSVLGQARVHDADPNRLSQRLLALMAMEPLRHPVGYCSFDISWVRRRGGEGAMDLHVTLEETWVRPELRREAYMSCAVADAFCRSVTAVDAGTTLQGASRVLVSVTMTGEVDTIIGEAFLLRTHAALAQAERKLANTTRHLVIASLDVVAAA